MGPSARQVSGKCKMTKLSILICCLFWVCFDYCFWHSDLISQTVDANLPHAAHDAKLLRGNEALQHDAYGHVDIILINILSQVHASMSLSHTNHGLNVTHRDRDATCGLQSSQASDVLQLD